MDNRARELSETSNGKFWDIWKKCDENITTKSPIACDGKKWESFYSNLFKDYDSNQFVNTLNTSVNQKKISKEHNQFINKLTSGAELKKIVKSLKNGKSPGIDRVSNEMIKRSFAILENCFVKLFNLILTVGCVPDIWCKGLITPVHKKGDSSNPDNFRTICVLSCLCRMLTNCLNRRLVETQCVKKKNSHMSLKLALEKATEPVLTFLV